VPLCFSFRRADGDSLDAPGDYWHLLCAVLQAGLAGRHGVVQAEAMVRGEY